MNINEIFLQYIYNALEFNIFKHVIIKQKCKNIAVE